MALFTLTVKTVFTHRRIFLTNKNETFFLSGTIMLIYKHTEIYCLKGHFDTSPVIIQGFLKSNKSTIVQASQQLVNYKEIQE